MLVVKITASHLNEDSCQNHDRRGNDPDEALTGRMLLTVELLPITTNEKGCCVCKASASGPDYQ